MTYVTHKERRALIYTATALAVALISLASVAGMRSPDPLATCSASPDTCAYALR